MKKYLDSTYLYKFSQPVKAVEFIKNSKNLIFFVFKYQPKL